MNRESVARYTLHEEVGQGGMSTVYRAWDPELQRDVAVKVLHDHIAKKAESRERFRREARAIAKLDHPNIVEVYDVSDEGDDDSYIVMEFLSGSNLAEFLETAPTPPSELAALVGVKLCNALTHAHRQGIIHRDLKPENIMITKEGQLRLMDFGIAHVVGADTMTKTGSLLGSPAHMAPELIESSTVDERSDIFALGTVLYLLNTGILPFEAASAPHLLRSILECDYTPPGKVAPRIHPEMGTVIETSLARDPEDRYQSADRLESALLETLDTVEIDDLDQTLTRYLRAPKEVTKEFTARLLEVLTREGKKRLDDGNIAGALTHFNRVLAFDPAHQEVNHHLDELHSKKNRRKFTRIGLTTVVAVCALVAGVYVWPTASPPKSAPTPRAVAATQPVIDTATRRARNGAALEGVKALSKSAYLSAERSGLKETARLHAAHVADRGRELAAGAVVSSGPQIEKSTASTTAPNPEPRPSNPGQPGDDSGTETLEYRFNVRPPKATLYIDGNRISRTARAEGVELSKGKHHIKAESEGCKPLERTLYVNEPRSEKIPVILEWKDARINVISNRKALVWIDGKEQRYIGVNGNDSTVQVPFGDARSLDTKRKLTVAVAPRSNLLQRRTQKVTVKPGERTSIHVQFDK